MDRNILLYPWYRALTAAMAWLPIFFLFFSDLLSLREVLLLEAVYYISVTILEVPSGYFSDVLGRKITLIISSILFVISYIVFGFSLQFWSLSMAQVLLAAAVSFRSGTDTSFYYESLSIAGREQEFPEREAHIQSLIQMSSAIAVLAGGFIGAISLNLPYLLSAIFVLPALIICFFFTEPKTDDTAAEPLMHQLKISFSYLNDKLLCWIFLYGMLMYIMTHIPYEFYQPYIGLLESKGDLVMTNAPIASGLLFAATRFIAAYSAKKSVRWTRRFGFYKVLNIALVIQLLLIGFLGLTLHLSILAVVLFRNFSMLLSIAPINAAIAPKINQAQRATYFSMQSLSYRLGFSITLIFLAIPFDTDAALDWTGLSWMLRTSFVVCLILFLLLNSIKPKVNGYEKI